MSMFFDLLLNFSEALPACSLFGNKLAIFVNSIMTLKLKKKKKCCKSKMIFLKLCMHALFLGTSWQSL